MDENTQKKGINIDSNTEIHMNFKLKQAFALAILLVGGFFSLLGAVYTVVKDSEVRVSADITEVNTTLKKIEDYVVNPEKGVYATINKSDFKIYKTEHDIKDAKEKLVTLNKRVSTLEKSRAGRKR